MAINILVPALGESVVEATVGRWFKQEGDRVAVGEALVELETEKVNLEVGAEQAGVLARIERHTGEDVRIGDVLGVVEPGADGARGEEGTQKAEQPAPKEQREKEREEDEKLAPIAESVAAVEATPVAKRLAEEQGIDLSQVKPSGPRGRITKEDVLAYLEKQQPERAAPEAAPAPPPATKAEAPAGAPEVRAPAPDQARREERVRMSRRRRTIARRLVEAQQTAAMLTTFNEVDMGAVMNIRQRRKESFKEKYGVSLGFMSFFVKASIGALKAFPQVNAEIDG
ncbi:MAG: 2-oxo acid dehydrogenase subunit E2, partial [Anaerolineales bacterium]